MSDPIMPTVPHVDLPRYLGTWFEICRLPLKWQAEGSRDVSATYTLSASGDIVVDNRCLLPDGTPDGVRGLAKAQDETNARLKVSFLPAYVRWLPVGWGDYWVLRLGGEDQKNYQLSLVGTPDRAHLWLLSRKAFIEHDVQADYLQTAAELGFDLSKLIVTEQSGKVVHIP